MPVDHDGLEEMYDEIRADRQFAHLRTPGIRLVPGIGADEPLAMVIGEAPGATENAKGEPFCGVSGRVLDQLMDIAGMYAREIRGCEDICHPPNGCCGKYKAPQVANVWLTNVVKFRPPGNRTPDLREQLAAAPYLRREWSLIGKPKLIVAVGRVAAQTIINTPLRGMTRGEIYPQRGQYVSFQYHPAFGLRQGKAMQDRIEEDWGLLGEQIQLLWEELGWGT